MNRNSNGSNLYRSSSWRGAGTTPHYTQSKLYDCFERWCHWKEEILPCCISEQPKTFPQKYPQPNLPTQLPIHASFSWVEQDEDQLFGRTLVSMLRSLPLAERNRMKVHIFALVANAQCELDDREYLV